MGLPMYWAVFWLLFREAKSGNCTYKFIAVLILGEVDGAKGTPTNLLLDHILIYAVYSSTIIIAASIV